MRLRVTARNAQQAKREVTAVKTVQVIARSLNIRTATLMKHVQCVKTGSGGARAKRRVQVDVKHQRVICSPARVRNVMTGTMVIRVLKNVALGATPL